MGPMTVFLLVLCLRSFFVAAVDDDDTDPHWQVFKTMYNKSYDTPEEEEVARDNFENNALDHMLHNMNDTNNYTQGMHEHSDKDPADAIEILCGTDVPANEESSNKTRRNFFTTGRLNQASWDWVEKGAVSDVKNQQSCGSCWAFTAAQALEGQAAIRWNSIYTISEQQMVDCASSYGNHGCDGGWPNNAFQYMISEGGEVMEYCYPYKNAAETCTAHDDCYHFKVKDYVKVGPAGDENAVADALASKGPLAIAIHVSDSLMNYDSGIFHDDDCNKAVNHGVLLVGYGTEDGQDFWKIKNSWGPTWGEKGYFRIARNSNNMCKVATYASYPVLA